MDCTELSIPGVYLLAPRVFRDSRGYFYESWQQERFAQKGLGPFVQDNHSRSVRGVLRGLHYQVSRPQSQLVYVSHGKIWDAVVDLRRNSPTFGKWCSMELTGDEPKQVYIPGGCAHGYCVLSETADVHYKVSEFYRPADEAGLSWNDPDVGIAWPIAEVTMSDRDRSYPRLRDIPQSRLPEIN